MKTNMIYGIPFAGRAVLCAAAMLAASTSAAARPPDIRVSANRHFLETVDGKPFFYLADTAWELFHRLDREEAIRYLDNRSALGFTVVQAVAIAEEDGVGTPNPYGFTPFVDAKTPVPSVKEGPDNDYWDHVDFIVDAANDRGLTVAMLPTWGKWWKEKCIFTCESARAYAEWLAARYRDKAIIWVLGGDRLFDGKGDVEMMRAFAQGVRKGDGGRHLITLHPRGGRGSSAPVGRSFTLNLEKIAGERIRFAWMSPRDGTMSPWTEAPRKARMSFAPPTPGELLDWVLVIERLSV